MYVGPRAVATMTDCNVYQNTAKDYVSALPLDLPGTFFQRPAGILTSSLLVRSMEWALAV